MGNALLITQMGNGSTAPNTYVDDVFGVTTYAGNISYNRIDTGFNLEKVGDPYWDNVTLLMGFDRSLVNEKTNTFMPPIASGSPVYSDSSSKVAFYKKSASIGQSGSGITFTTGLSVQSSNPLNVNFSQPFCIEGWLAQTASENGVTGGVSEAQFISVAGSGGSFSFYSYKDALGGIDQVVVTAPNLYIEVAGAINSTTKYVRITFTGSNLYLHINGIQYANEVWAGYTVGTVTNTQIYAQAEGGGVSGTSASVFLDELRWTFGVSRSADMTSVPTAPFPRTSATNAALAKDAMIWTKARNQAYSHSVKDTIRGASSYISSDTTSANSTHNLFFARNGYNATFSQVDGLINNSGVDYVNYTFVKAPKFFDIVTYTGNGANRLLSHALNCEVGMIWVKSTSNNSNWVVYHRSLFNNQHIVMNISNGVVTDSTMWANTTASTTQFSIGTNSNVNTNGGTYVAYLFAHDPSADGLIQCGTYTTDGSNKASVTLGWEPQLCINKQDAVQDWRVVDSSRDMRESGAAETLALNTTAASNTVNGNPAPNATGFTVTQFASGEVYYYMAIRRSNKPPTSGTQVYNAIARTGTGAAATVTGVGFAPDSVICKARTGVGTQGALGSRLVGNGYVRTSSTAAEVVSPSNSLSGWSMDGISIGGNASDFNDSSLGSTYINHFFKRAVGVFDVVCYTGAGIPTSFNHNLAILPELIITKCRETEGTVPGTGNNPGALNVWYTSLGVNPSGYGDQLMLNTNIAKGQYGLNVKALTSSIVTFGNNALTAGAGCTSGKQFVAYLFASKAGISKVGSYTGNGSSQNINCGFAAGARFILIKRTDAAGDWYLWDTARGIVAGNDPYIRLNTTAAEVTTDDSVDPLAAGFIVNQVAATNINVNTATYIYLAIA